MSAENYVYKKEVDWSLLTEGLTLPIHNQVVFGTTMGRFLQKGESKIVNLYLSGKAYKAKITNVNFDKRFKRTNDILQIRYPRNGELARALQGHFIRSYEYITNARNMRLPDDRRRIMVPKESKEYLAIYTTEDDDSFILETIQAEDIVTMKQAIKGQQERTLEAVFNYDAEDPTSTIVKTERFIKIRKLNKKIGDNLKLLYDYRCQICGKAIGKDFGSHIVEAHHINYFVNSLNNDAENQLIVCPNHHAIIHDQDPVFDRTKLIYFYRNGVEQKILLNKHL